MDNIKAYVTYSELMGRVPTQDEFIARLSRMGLHSLAVTLSSLMRILYNDGVATPELQMRMAYRALTPAMFERLRRLPNARERVVFFPQQILFTMKFAVMHSPNIQDPRPDDAFRDDLVEILLMASEFLDDMSGMAGNTRRALLSHLVRNFLLNATDQFRYMLPRAAILYITLPNEPDLRNDPGFLDIAGVFRDATGVALADFIAFGLALFPWFIEQSELRGTFTQERQSMNPDTLFSNARIDPAVARRVLEALLHTHESLVTVLRERLAAYPGTLRDAYDFLAFMGRPLYQVRHDVLVPVHLGYLAARFSGGIYWTVFDYLRDAEVRLQFSSFFGRVFEVYVRRSIQRSIPDRGELARRVYPEFIYRTRDGDRKTSDVIVVYERAAIFIEATASRIRMEETAITGDLRSFEADIGRIVIKKAEQLTDRIRDFRAGLYTIGGLSHRELPRIYPVIATFQSLPESFFTWEYINERLTNEGLLQGAGIAPLQVLDIEEIEILEGILPQGVSLLEILQRRIDDPQRRYISMKNFLIATIGERGVNEYMQGRYRELGAHITNLLFPNDDRPAE
jgi:hypothetical protein